MSTGAGHLRYFPRTRYSASRTKRPKRTIGVKRPIQTTAVHWLRSARALLRPGPAKETGTRSGPLARALLASGCCLLGSGAWLALGRRTQRVKVFGPSMQPGLEGGDRLVVWRARSIRPGDIVAAYHPQQEGMVVVKRVALVGAEGAVLLGDNPDRSTDSRHYGPVPLDRVIGRAIYRYFPTARAGRLSRGTSTAARSTVLPATATEHPARAARRSAAAGHRWAPATFAPKGERPSSGQ